MVVGFSYGRYARPGVTVTGAASGTRSFRAVGDVEIGRQSRRPRLSIYFSRAAKERKPTCRKHVRFRARGETVHESVSLRVELPRRAGRTLFPMSIIEECNEFPWQDGRDCGRPAHPWFQLHEFRLGAAR